MFGEELVEIVQDDGRVRARIRSTETGSEQILTAQYLVGADGARSTVRHQIGAKMAGAHGLSRNNMTIFEAPGLAEAQGHGPALYETPLALIRPDQHVAWRGKTVPGDLLARATGHDCHHSMRVSAL